MATRKKTAPARVTKAKMAHSDPSSDHEDGGVRITITVGPIERIRKKGRKGTPKEVKAFLKWVLTEL